MTLQVKNNIIKYIIVLQKEDGDSLEQYFTNNPNLKSELRNIVYKYQGLTMSFFSDNGVFSKDKLDFGSTLLLETVFQNINNDNLNILDKLEKMLDECANKISKNTFFFLWQTKFFFT